MDDTEEDEKPYIRKEFEQSPVRTQTYKIYKPYSEDYLNALKEARNKDIKNQKVASDLISYIVFLAILFIISYANRDPDSFKLRKHLENRAIYKYDFDLVRNSD